MRGFNLKGLQLLLLSLTLTGTSAHSWVEQLTVIAPNGTFVGPPGYPRGNALRTSADYSDKSMTYLATDQLCKDTQQTQTQTDKSPRLQASPGAPIALRYQENGHVTLPDTQKGKPKNRGTVYVYGTTNPKEGEKLADVHKVWNRDGTGGDKRGVLLSTQDFDDGRCYQVNGGPISTSRQAQFPHPTDQLMGADLWCQHDLALPTNAPSGKPYTLYWVWDWPTAAGADPGLPDGKQEIYTTCMDVDVAGDPQTKQPAKYNSDQPLNSAAIPAQFAQTMGSSGPSGTPSKLAPLQTAAAAIQTAVAAIRRVAADARQAIPADTIQVVAADAIQIVAADSIQVVAANAIQVVVPGAFQVVPAPTAGSHRDLVRDFDPDGVSHWVYARRGSLRIPCTSVCLV
ncbi:uncharacterized protein BDW47DRAFT_131758 [Aspergillus candidus]|uniref:DUF7492 domain-containing protein n=1 Tax=Aspergillus candidus TaxID=41067 RepID=A0A2I2FB44_ASPCN|nr:hypothetical protein BDW47DRAFT_131758 [Aspergillus candidus]PLB37849.1 hypothetical protein BDW47DRAFT_131758 [Aspergillus candidus]